MDERVEYIDREAFREHIDTVYPFTKYGQKIPEYDYAKSAFLMALSEFPSADVIPVVRCKECKYWKRLKRMKLYGDCQYNGLHEENYFCAYGVKMRSEPLQESEDGNGRDAETNLCCCRCRSRCKK